MSAFDVYRIRRNRVPDTGSTGGGSTGGAGQALFATSFGVSDGWTVDSTALTASPGATGNSPTVSRGGGGTAGMPQDVVATAANRQDGRGHRHYRGPGTNDNGGGISIGWGGTNPEIWFRYYIRFSAGLVWNGGGNPGYSKDWVLAGNKLFVGHEGPGKWGFNVNGGPSYGGTADWVSLMGSSAGDGLWHCFEWYFNINTNAGKLWIDDVLTVDVISTSPFSAFTTSFNGAFTGNQYAMTSSGHYTDYDDIVVTSTGRIGL